MKTTFLGLALAAALAVPAAADRAEDDLAAVKKAVRAPRAGSPSRPAEEQRPAAEARRPAEAPPVEEDAPAVRPQARRADAPRWFRVRVVGKGDKRGSVSISLPLGLVRAFGEDWPIHGCHRCQQGRGPTVGDVLRSLDSGQSLVEIDDEGASVRVWVD